MRLNRNTLSLAILIILCFTAMPGFAQLGFSYDIKKPDQYDDRILGSEKTETKKFTLPRRFTQNTFTHYNYFFNANNKLNEVIELAKSVHVDDYSELLSFYNYSLDMTSQNTVQLDSIIYKTNTGIVLHDLRSDWVDNLYLITGAAYFLRQDFDSAYLTFQFINYAFAQKEKDGYYKNIGSNMDGNNAFSISTKEKNSLPKKIFGKPPSRNESFIWLIRTLIAQEEYAEAASLIVTLKNDPVFPKRLKTDLEEVQALWFYNNNNYDSAALHLSKALDNATTKIERARWEFLTAQLYELSNKPAMAKSFYDKVINHTTDPVMEIYARLRSIRMNKEGGENFIQNNITELVKMAKRDKYVEYRDIIYFTIAQMELERGDLKAAQNYLAKSAEFNNSNANLKNKAWLQLAELALKQKDYKVVRNCFDSLNLNDPLLTDIEKHRANKDLYGRIADYIEVVERQDSLQKIAAMPEDARKEFVKKLTRQIRKEQGLKEEPSTLVPIGNVQQQQQPQIDLFNSSSKGEWYFYNAAIRLKGLSEFKSKWGNRPNADNWRRLAAIGLSQNTKSQTPAAASRTDRTIPAAPTGEIDFEFLYNKLPLTDELMQVSNDSLSEALFMLGKSLTDEVEDCTSSIEALEKLKAQFPDYKKMDEVLFSLFYCYTKNGETGKANGIKKLMEQKFADNPLTKMVSTGKDPRSKTNNPEATKTYENIYNLFIEGKFAEAESEKAKADATYGSHYWTPQLLYIEAVYYIKQKEDSKATSALNNIVQTFPKTPMADKASKLIEVLSRRKQIEDELTNLNIERPVEIVPKKIDTLATVVTPVKTDSVIQKPKQLPVQTVAAPPVVVKKDSITSKPVITAYEFKAVDKYSVMILLNKTDPVWANEAKNAFNIYNRNKFFNRQFELSITGINDDTRALLIGSFDNAQAAVDYLQTVKPISPSQIIPWLAADRYSFTIISSGNLEILKTVKDINIYKQFIEKNLPGKF